MKMHVSPMLLRLFLKLKGIYQHQTLGARCAVILEGRVLMVRHGYAPGWQFPGGGVDPGEDAQTAARREVLEETGYQVEGALQLAGFYHCTAYTDRDHVALYVANAARQARAFEPNREIVEIGWHDINAMPEDLAPSAARRIAELRGERDVSPHW